MLTDSLLTEEEARAFLPMLFRDIPVSIAVSERISDTVSVVLAVNDEYSKMTGFSRNELIGRDTSLLNEMIHPEDLQRIRTLLASGQSVTNMVIPWKQKDGMEKWALSSIRILSLEQRTLLVNIALDIDLQKQAERDLAVKYEELQAAYEELVAMEETLHQQHDELKATDARLALSEERFRLATEMSEIGLLDSDLLQPGQPFWLSSNWLYRLGLDHLPLPIEREVYVQRIHPQEQPERAKRFAALLGGDSSLYEMEYRILDREGKWLWVLVRGNIIRDSCGKPIRLIGTMTDISELKNREMQRYYQATHDELTGLLNRRGFMEAIAALRSSDRQPVTGGLLVVDIDGFRFINDVHGQEVGDEFLQAFAQHLKDSFPQDTLLARFGADEYLAFFPELTDAAAANKLFHPLVVVLLQTSAGSFAARSSGGFFLCGGQEGTPESFVQKAVLAMHHAKIVEKSACYIYEPSMQAVAVRRHAIREGLSQALQNQEFFLQYQPIYAIEAISERIIGFEALLRWRSPSLGMVSPAEFIPVAEETSLILPIGEWVMQEACQFFSGLNAQIGCAATVAVNVSVRQLLTPGFSSRVKSILQQCDLPPGQLGIEVTESIMMTDEQHNIAVLNELRAMGVSISLDDFGTGYSSFTYLQKLPIDVLKVDKSLIDEIAHPDRNALLLMESLVQMSRLLGYRIVAEGVENSDQLVLLRKIGCGACQGYLLGKPLPAEAVAKLFASYESSAWPE
jgi:diguanylate cyclase (GGDEF)-like protein/PAS domain S-box-containing protein